MFRIVKSIETKSKLVAVMDSMFVFLQNSYVKALNPQNGYIWEGASKKGQVGS